MTTFIQKTFTNLFRLIILIIIVIFGLGIYGNILLTRAQERSQIEAVDSYISQKRIPVGVDGYGYISTINVKVGDKVNEGDVLFTYFGFQYSNPKAGEAIKTGDPDSLFEGFQEISVKALSAGSVKIINFYKGSYITQDVIVMEMQSLDTFVWASLRVDPDDIFRIKVGNNVTHTFPNGVTTSGKIRSIYPFYEKENKILKVETTIEGLDIEMEKLIIEGLPLKTTVFIDDPLGKTIESRITNLYSTITTTIVQKQ